MFHLSAQTRSWQVKFIQELVHAFVNRKQWDPATVLVLHKGKTGPANMLDACKAIFVDGKVYDIAGKKMTAGEILAKAEAFDAKNAKAKLPVLVEGRHRAVALWLASIFFAVDIEPETTEVSDEMAARIGFEANLTNEVYAKMLATEKLDGIINAIKTGVYTKQTDIPTKRGQQQSLWHRANAAIVQGLTDKDSLEKLSSLDYKAAKAIAEGSLTIDAALEAKAGNVKKVLPGEKIRDLLKMCQNYDQAGASPVTKLLAAIVENAEVTAKTVIVDSFRQN